MERQQSESSGRGCLLMTLGALMVLLEAANWLGAGINKTDTGPLFIPIAIAGGALLVVGIVRRVKWVRGSD